MTVWIKVLIAAIIAAAIATAAYRTGVNSQKVADQVEFDRINDETADMKAQANAAYRIAQDFNLKTMKERDTAKTELLKEKQKHEKSINDDRARYANVGLRYSTGQATGLGASGANALPGTGSAAGNVTSIERELPAAITAGLRAIAYDCDALNVEYRTLYEWANGKKPTASSQTLQ